MKGSEQLERDYTDAIIKQMSSTQGIQADTLYIGGGTPSCMSIENLTAIIKTAKNSFCIENTAEITVECNPSSNLKSLLPQLAQVGVNRISMGLQSAIESERKALGRIAKPEDVTTAIETAHAAGIDNISLDLMIAIPSQTQKSLEKSIDFCANSGATHVSAYILKIEEDTHFYKIKDRLDLPNEEKIERLYMTACEKLETAGFAQYEISNFAKSGFESRHNIKYWNCDEYLGFGASAHSFYKGKRSFFERDIDKYIEAPKAIQDGAGGDFEEYVMMRLRLAEGLQNKAVKARFKHPIPNEMITRAKKLENHGLVECDENGIRLTKQGFLVSNSIISELLY